MKAKYRKAIGIVIAFVLVYLGLSHIKGIRYEIGRITYRLSEAAGIITEGVPDVTIVCGTKGFNPYFPDVCKSSDGLLAAYYWNKMHAPLKLGDPLGNIMLVHGSSDGESWGTPEPLISQQTLIEWGVDVWVDEAGVIYNNQTDAIEHNAQFAVEARDPNLQMLKDGKILLTFFTRLPDASKKTDSDDYYTYGGTYITVSYDDGLTWEKPEQITSSLLDSGCAKRGNIAEFPNGDLLIPLYGSNSAHPEIFLTAAVRGRFVDNAFQVVEEYHESAFDDSTGLFRDGDTEVSFLYFGGKTYAFARSSGLFCVSDDEGKTWKKITDFQGTDERNIMQPYLIPLGEHMVLINWTERLSAENRAVFGKLYDPTQSWNNYPEMLIFSDRYGVDMGDPSSVLLDNNVVFTIFYDTGIGQLAGMFNSVSDLS